MGEVGIDLEKMKQGKAHGLLRRIWYRLDLAGLAAEDHREGMAGGIGSAGLRLRLQLLGLSEVHTR